MNIKSKYAVLLLATRNNNAKRTHHCVSVATFSILIKKILTLSILYMKIQFVPHRKHLMHRVFSWGTNYIFIRNVSSRHMCVYIFDRNTKSPCGRSPRQQWTLEVFAVQNTLSLSNKGYANALHCYVTLTLTILWSPTWCAKFLFIYILYNTFTKILYMFRALPCSTSGGLLRCNCIYAASGFVTLCMWLSCSPVKKVRKSVLS
jgi:hypothetical protein